MNRPPDPLPEKGRNRRTHTLVRGSFQTRYVLIASLFVTGLTLLIFLDFFDYVRREILNDPTCFNVSCLVEKQMLPFLLRFGLYVASVVTFLYVLLHRVAGPVLHFRKVTQALMTGDLTQRVALRKHDGLKDLENDFNAMAASLQQLVATERDAAARLIALTKNLQKTHDLSPATRQHLDALLVGLNQLFTRFKI